MAGFSGRLIQVGSHRPAQVAFAGQGPMYLVNRDPAVTVYLGSDEGLNPAGNDVSVLDPLGSLPLDGETDVWALTQTGTAIINALPGTSAWAPSPAQIAAQIALKGINVNVSQYTMSPSGDPSGVTDFNTFNGLVGITKLLTMAPGLYTFNANWPQLSIGQKVKGSGFGVTTCKFLSSGDCVRFTQAGPYTGAAIGGGVNDLTIDGSAHAAGASAGLHAGDIESLDFNGLEIINFNGAGDVGYHFDNTIFFTERLQGIMRARNNSTHYLFDVSGAATSTGSFARPNVVLFYSSPVPTQNGVVLQNGANIYDLVMFAIMANHGAGSSGTPGSCLTVTGSVPAGHPGAGQGSRIQFGKNLIIGAESSAGTVFPQTINFGGPGNVIDCGGSMTFSGFTASNLVASGATWHFNGPVDGDSTLPAFEYGGQNHQGAIATGGTIQSYTKRVTVNPGAPATGIILAAGAKDGQDIRITNVNAANNLTFAAAGTSNVALGASVVIPPQGHADFTWDASNNLWY